MEEGDYVLVDLKSENESFNRGGICDASFGKRIAPDEFPFPGFARAADWAEGWRRPRQFSTGFRSESSLIRRSQARRWKLRPLSRQFAA